jgi:hypothetical protein
MTEKPILFSGEMVRALLDGRKTMTRRIVKGNVIENGHGHCQILRPNGHYQELVCPYGQPGDRLWVRERISKPLPLDVESKCFTGYYFAGDEERKIKWIPSIHMPRWASRITLEVTSVRVERLQEITEADAKAEGVTKPSDHPLCVGDCRTAYSRFKELWDRINAERAVWESNPWVWVVTFKRVTP